MANCCDGLALFTNYCFVHHVCHIVCQMSWQPRRYSTWNSKTSPGIQLLVTTLSNFYLHYNLKNTLTRIITATISTSRNDWSITDGPSEIFLYRRTCCLMSPDTETFLWAIFTLLKTLGIIFYSSVASEHYCFRALTSFDNKVYYQTVGCPTSFAHISFW